jgi:hypothetical protein
MSECNEDVDAGLLFLISGNTNTDHTIIQLLNQLLSTTFTYYSEYESHMRSSNLQSR